MSERVLHIYLHSPWREAAEAGKVNLFQRLALALPGWRLDFHPDTPEERQLAPDRGPGLFHMQEPTGPNILCLRKAYILPFWRIEAVAERWLFDVALTTFEADTIPRDEAVSFVRRWYPKIIGTMPPSREGFVLIPLQGRLRQRRSFQAASPLQMVETVLDRVPHKPILATLHPNESYDPEDLDALNELERRFPRFQVASEPTSVLLPACDAVVTQNSGVALLGFFAKKPAVLFGETDFHHIAGSVLRDGLDAAFSVLDGPPPEFSRYLCWFLRRQAINGGAPECEDQIRARFLRHGWDI